MFCPWLQPDIVVDSIMPRSQRHEIGLIASRWNYGNEIINQVTEILRSRMNLEGQEDPSDYHAIVGKGW